jgi:hypothetical protein
LTQSRDDYSSTRLRELDQKCLQILGKQTYQKLGDAKRLEDIKIGVNSVTTPQLQPSLIRFQKFMGLVSAVVQPDSFALTNIWGLLNLLIQVWPSYAQLPKVAFL